MAASTTTVKNPGTQRQDNWWLEPALVIAGLAAFVIYVTFRLFMGFNENFAESFIYEAGGAHYASPFISPDVSPLLSWALVPMTEAIRKATGWEWFVLSPALWILWVPALFRATCYFYRRVYYRAFFTAPPACAVSAGTPSPLQGLLGQGETYRGERKFPLVLNNLHRYFLYMAILFVFIHIFDLARAFFFDGAFGIGIGTAVIGLDVLFLALYVFSCHSWRHLLAGRLDCFSCDFSTAARHHAWERQSKLNAFHGAFAWISLFWVAFTDFYIWMATANPGLDQAWVSGFKLF